MTMDYNQSHNGYPGYYCPPYQESLGYRYPQQPTSTPSRYRGSQTSPSRNFHNIATGPPPEPQPHNYQPQQNQQRPQPYSSAFQQTSQQQHSNYSSAYLPNFLVSSGTGLTPTLTPTTLATIEQSFLELQSAQQNRSWDSVTQSGFVPPVVDAGHSTEVSQDSQDYSSEYSDSEWEPKAKRGRMSEVMKDIKNVDIIVTSSGVINAAPQRKYTRRNKDEKLPPEEEEKRRVRRERNKLAAAKCRQRRVDHTNILVAETEKLEAEQSQLESEIQSLQQEKDQLEFILQAHQPLCQVDQPRPRSGKVKIEPGTCTPNCNLASHDTSCLVPENLSLSTCAPTGTMTALSTSLAAITTSTSQVTLDPSGISSRPNSLPLIKRNRAHMLSSVAGITINTPTSGMTITPSSLFCPGLDSMIDGSTGLTPLTGMSCSSQVQRNSNENGSENESSLISL